MAGSGLIQYWIVTLTFALGFEALSLDRGAGLLSTDPVARAGLLNRALTLVLVGVSPSR